MQSDLIHIKGKLYRFDDLWIMAIMNLSEDSFFEHYTRKTDKSLLNHAEQLILNGANIIDIGAVSTRPEAPNISSSDEIKKIGSTISLLKKTFPSVLISADTFSEKTINFVIDEGADIINDISGGAITESCISHISQHKLGYILTYNRGGKKNNVLTRQLDSIISDALLFFSEKLQIFTKNNLIDIILDPGFGFNKSLEDNFKLLKESENLKILERPILYGLSRKSMIYKTLNISVEEALNGTTILNTFAACKGANILRVHDVAEARQLKTLLSSLKSN